jgi:hypothetical protein
MNTITIIENSKSTYIGKFIKDLAGRRFYVKEEIKGGSLICLEVKTKVEYCIDPACNQISIIN